MFSRYTTNTSGGNLNFGEIIWKSFHRSNNNAIIRCTSQSGPSLLGWDDAGRLEFLTQVGAQTPSIRMVIAENGNVGIGITSPNAQLSINNDFHIAANSSAWNSTVGKGIFMRYSTNAGQDSECATAASIWLAASDSAAQVGQNPEWTRRAMPQPFPW